MAAVEGIMGNVCEGQRVLGIKVTYNRHGLLTSRGIERERERERERQSERQKECRETAHRRKCDMGCPIMTPLPNTADKTHGEWKRECGRQGERVKGERQAAEGRGCDVTAQQCQRLPQKGQRRQRGAVSHGERRGEMQKQKLRICPHQAG